MEFIRKFFNLPNDSSHPQGGNKLPAVPNHEENQRSTFLKPNDFENGIPDDQFGAHFNVFTDPLEMHRYFEQQMDQIFKSFGLPNFGKIFESFDHPSLHRRDNLLEEYSPDSREQFLKKDHELPHFSTSTDKVDKDLDGKLTIKDIDTLFEKSRDGNLIEKPSKPSIFGQLKPFQARSFNQSVQVKTIRKPDGSMETQRIVTDSEGNRETTITQRMGDKEYSIVKRIDKEGKEEVHETMINMEENERGLFSKPTEPVNPGFDQSIFSKFFK